jgi:nitroimidazol reductase NimA-like FMN-containing flavoprotein (pyridoxamine 5'-phosphate oxidase superfamily)
MRQKGPWSTDRIEEFLREVRVPVRVACNGGSGHPVLASLWFVPLEGRLWCATQRGARIASILRRDPRCGFEVSVEAPPYWGVRGIGRATLHDERGEEMLRVLIDRYLGDANSRLASSLLARAEQETSICIEPLTLVSWDYRERMGAAA